MATTPDRSSAERAIDPSIAERVAALRLDTAQVVDGVLSGLHRSPHRGASVVFVEHRDYRPGDDLRLLDWRAYARNDRHVTKRFEQETELSLHLWLDASASMAFGRGALEKSRWAATFLAAFATLTQAQGDAVGVVRFDRALREELPPRTSPAHLRAVLEALAVPPEQGARTRLDVLAEALERTRRRGVVLVASDLLDTEPAALVPIELAARRGHDVRVFQVLHPDELELPGDGPARYDGLEGEAPVEADPVVLRAEYQEELGRHLEACRQRVLDAGGRYRLVRTDASIVAVLVETLVDRLPRRGLGGAATRPRWG
jgi:uncharacterized protein (DUF58 family)